MPNDELNRAVRQLVSATYGDTSDLSEELVNTLTNIYYFALKARKLNFGGLGDIQDIHIDKSQEELVSIYMKHMQHVMAATELAPSLVENLRGIRRQEQEQQGHASVVFDTFEQVTIDLLKYDIKNAERKTEFKRALERKLRVPSEIPNLARQLRVPFRGARLAGESRAEPKASTPVREPRNHIVTCSVTTVKGGICMAVARAEDGETLAVVNSINPEMALQSLGVDSPEAHVHEVYKARFGTHYELRVDRSR